MIHKAVSTLLGNLSDITVTVTFRRLHYKLQTLTWTSAKCDMNDDVTMATMSIVVVTFGEMLVHIMSGVPISCN